jgi:hypothetical protein
MTSNIRRREELAQLELQQKLGRCMLRLQQYERLLKAMVGTMAVEGPIEQLHAFRVQQESDASDKSLGVLVRMFIAGHLTPTLPTGEARPRTASNDDKRPDVAWASMKFQLAMSPERQAQTKNGLAELVSLRNELVHHLIERYDISDESGCRAASIHLDRCYEQIDGHCKLLRSWATTLVESQALASSYLHSNAFDDMFVHGIHEDGSVCWPRSTIVECLREAEAECQIDGWTSLDAAVTFVLKKNQDQVPSRYGCKTWRQVLRKSGLFELRSTAKSDGAIGHAWYRSCAKDPAPL